MELKEMIKVMQHYEDGGEVENKEKHSDDAKWILACPVWNWDSFDYRIKPEKQKVTIEKWLCRDNQGDYEIIESSNVNKYRLHDKVKLIETYEVEL